MENPIDTEENKLLKRIVEISEEFLQSSADTLDYQKITDNILDISGAKYAGFNLYTEDGYSSRTVAISAPDGIIKKAASLFSFKFLGKKWEHDPARAEKIKPTTITRFPNLSELAGNFIYKPIATLLEKTFKFGEVVFVKIEKENIMLGDFTLVMPSNISFKNDTYVEIYARQTGLLITRNRSEIKRIESAELVRSTFAAVSDSIFLLDQETGAIMDVNDAACALYGYTRAEMLKLKNVDMSAEPDKTKKATNDFYAFVPVRYHKKKDGTLFAVEITANLFELSGRKVIIESMRDITERKKAEDALRQSEEKYRLIIENSHDIIYILNMDGIITFASPSWIRILGHPLNQVEGKPFQQFIHPDDIKKALTAIQKVMATGKITFGIEYRALHIDGSWRWHVSNAIPLKDAAGTIIGFEGIARDITERRIAEEKLLETNHRQKMANAAGGVGIWNLNLTTNELTWDDQMFALYGITRKQFTSVYQAWISGLHPEDAERGDREIQMAARGEKEFDTEFRVVWPDGTIHHINARAQVRRDGTGKPLEMIGTNYDITDRKRAEEVIIHLSYHDQLTGLYNRRFFKEEIKRLDTKRQLPLSIILGDLNNLKLTNDAFGHQEGDRLLTETAKLLKKVCRSDDILARWGGDEFVILLPKTSIAAAEEIAQRIEKECSELFIQKIPIGLAIGIAAKTESRQNMEDIIFEAESNMYKNKLAGKQSNAGSVIAALEQALYEKSNETMDHTQRLRELSIKLGKKLNLHPHQLDELSLLASLHDIGKVAVPETILLKEGALSEKEWEVIRKHPATGFNIAQSSPQIAHIAKYILSCHENWDGSGYPSGLAKEKIPLLSRIMAIADSYDVMTSKRTYKSAMSKDDAVKELRRCSGTQFDPALVEKFIEVLAEQAK